MLAAPLDQAERGDVPEHRSVPPLPRTTSQPAGSPNSSPSPARIDARELLHQCLTVGRAEQRRAGHDQRRPVPGGPSTAAAEPTVCRQVAGQARHGGSRRLTGQHRRRIRLLPGQPCPSAAYQVSERLAAVAGVGPRSPSTPGRRCRRRHVGHRASARRPDFPTPSASSSRPSRRVGIPEPPLLAGQAACPSSADAIAYDAARQRLRLHRRPRFLRGRRQRTPCSPLLGHAVPIPATRCSARAVLRTAYQRSRSRHVPKVVDDRGATASRSPSTSSTRLDTARRGAAVRQPGRPVGAVCPPSRFGRSAVGVERGVSGDHRQIYEHLTSGPTGSPRCPRSCPTVVDQCIVVNGVAKTYAMTGWRVGSMIVAVRRHQGGDQLPEPRHVERVQRGAAGTHSPPSPATSRPSR